jgi:hypothetical protein
MYQWWYGGFSQSLIHSYTFEDGHRRDANSRCTNATQQICSDTPVTSALFINTLFPYLAHSFTRFYDISEVVSSPFQKGDGLSFKSSFVNRFSILSKSLCRVLFAIDALQIGRFCGVLGDPLYRPLNLSPQYQPAIWISQLNGWFIPEASTTLKATRLTWLTVRPKPKSYMLRILISVSGGIANGFSSFRHTSSCRIFQKNV